MYDLLTSMHLCSSSCHSQVDGHKMRFNSRELAALAQQDKNKFDKEGVLLIKERQEGLFRKGECKLLTRDTQIQTFLSLLKRTMDRLQCFTRHYCYCLLRFKNVLHLTVLIPPTPIFMFTVTII